MAEIDEPFGESHVARLRCNAQGLLQRAVDPAGKERIVFGGEGVVQVGRITDRLHGFVSIALGALSNPGNNSSGLGIKREKVLVHPADCWKTGAPKPN